MLILILLVLRARERASYLTARKQAKALLYGIPQSPHLGVAITSFLVYIVHIGERAPGIRFRNVTLDQSGAIMDDQVLINDSFVFFWGGWPSQWHKSCFVIDGTEYNCCEQFMMAEKARVFADESALKSILASNNPRQQKAAGRQIQRFNESVWNSVCRGIVYRGNLAKYEQNPDLCRLLIETGRRIIVEASPRDCIWGIGLSQTDPRALDTSQWRGTNWLGIALMQVRDELGRYRGLPAGPFDDDLRRQLETRAGMV